MNQNEEWLPMKEVSKKLKVNYNTISRLVALGKLTTRLSSIDRRVKLVEVNEVKRVFAEG
jgi:hypothetical protein